MNQRGHERDVKPSEAAEALRDPGLYEDCSSAPKVIETHISVVYLTDRHAYKLKKPLHFDFLDYSTVERRRAACEEEVRLNRRLARDVYLGTIPVGRDLQGQWRLDGNIVPEDWVVKMKRLPANRCLQSVIREGTWTPEDVARIIALLSDFYRAMDPAPGQDYVERQRRLVRENHDELLAAESFLPPGDVQRIHARQREFLFVHGDSLRRRVEEGHVVEGHGDLRAEHFYLTDPPAVIDGIEFSRKLRTVDVADELCFLLITCEILGSPELGREVLQGVCAARNDAPNERLLDFYCCYRACVRAKVDVIKAGQIVGDAQADVRQRAASYLDLAAHYAERLGSPLALIVRGLSGTGKSTLATSIASAIAADYLSTDVTRRATAPPADVPRYSDEARQQVYDAMIEEGARRISRGASVVLDGTFLKTRWMSQAVDRLTKAGGAVHIATCKCPDLVALRRIIQRQQDPSSVSDADASVLLKQRENEQPLPEGIEEIEIDTTLGGQAMLTHFRRALQAAAPAPHRRDN